jgi:hypothetical protein
MDKEECFALWAPEASVWSAWAKPVVFVHLDSLGFSGDMPVAATPEVPWGAPAALDRAVIVDLPGPDAVVTGLALAGTGHHPVPVFNGNVHAAGVIDVEPIARRIWHGSGVLYRTDAGPDAPPAFLIDAQRMSPLQRPDPGRFDNRWIVLPQDFPSATFLMSRGITRALLIHAAGAEPAEDLAHVLRRWQDAGVSLERLEARAGAAPAPLHVKRPSFFRRAWYRAIALSGLRRNAVGGFGAIVPVATSHFG